MVKLVALIVSKEGIDHDDFVSYWRENHVPMVSQLDGLRRYTTAVPLEPEKAPYDGVAEAYFDSKEAVDEAFATDLGREIRADEDNFVERVAFFVTDESVELD
jgi:uncharacterized protein (TIGR02118 family)